MNNKYFTLYSNCLMVKGISRSIICDTQNRSYELIPNDLYELFNNSTNSIDIKEKVTRFNEYDKETLNEYLDFLNKKNYGFYSNKIFKGLVPISRKWKSFAQITNCVIEYNDEKEFPWLKIVNSLNQLNCIALEIRFYGRIELDKLNSLMNFFKNSRLRSITLLIKYSSEITSKTLNSLTLNNSRISEILIHDCIDDLQKIFTDIMVPIHCLSRSINNKGFCGVVLPKFFSKGLQPFTEALNHNSCLNRKISIDIEGNIKNCPSTPKVYGNIFNNSLESAAEDKEFQKLWNLTKDQVLICKDCEFRYICTDCRAYLENPEDLYSKPLKCGYDPYANTWEEWSTNPLKKKAMDFYQMLK
ncbi:grasp-with-spasm system SPASM domain peptide maturase [Aquimarina sp. ERC-38]|uniref:grasp-with-spasm system SPASM domain peptide maturase n=1 Tax=Aquimarina sp. ERC-38 TaxID=2949996 RepID=UPI002246912F|nr:grasp-with-spasm system SPASM domain peptide maturase [Aquimarina sp. ERC-38]UZO82069.1 grasp-with-spasm system SPASM domain peptide maturase [Aquimarina sp. ERC-38]